MREFFWGFIWLLKEISFGRQYTQAEVEPIVYAYLKAHGETTTFTLSKLFEHTCYDINTLKRVNAKCLTVATLYVYLDSMTKAGLIVTEDKDTVCVDGVTQNLGAKRFVRKLPSEATTNA